MEKPLGGAMMILIKSGGSKLEKSIQMYNRNIDNREIIGWVERTCPKSIQKKVTSLTVKTTEDFLC